MYKLKCDNCGEIEHVLVDGYAFGDTILEGVMFKVYLDGDSLRAEVMPNYAGYFSELNEKLWLQRASKFVNETEMFTCSICKNDIDGPGAI